MKVNSPVDTHVGNRVRSLRVAKGMSHEDLAASIGTTVRQLEKWESGESRIGGVQLRRISQQLGVDAPYFLVGTQPEPLEAEASPSEAPSSQSVFGVPLSIEALRLVRAFSAIENHELRQVVIKFVETTAGVERNNETNTRP
jgi:transcriptional regulator with XRE-family HTH domain